MARVHVVPQLAIMDEVVEIIVENLPPFAPVTIDVFNRRNGSLYAGIGQYYADKNGTVNSCKAPSFGGTYHGLKKMGLFSTISKLPSRNIGTRFLVKDDAREVLEFKVSVWKGHLSEGEVHILHLPYSMFGTYDDSLCVPGDLYRNHFLCETISKRTYLDSSIKRVPVLAKHQDEAIAGTLFIPPGKGPFPAVIDTFGSIGGAVEFRAALLAKHGFITLALAYFHHEGLPYKTFWDYPITYFDHVVDWLLSQKQVSPMGVGIIGSCQGAQNALLAGLRHPKILATICVAPQDFMVSDPSIEMNPIRALYTETCGGADPLGTLTMIDGKAQVKPGSVPPIMQRPLLTTKHDNAILFLVGSDDKAVHGAEIVESLREQLNRSGKKKHFVEFVPGQGHLLEPPYTPLCEYSRDIVGSPQATSTPKGDYWKLLNELVWNWGGQRQIHEEGQVDSWKITTDFFRKYLTRAKL